MPAAFVPIRLPSITCPLPLVTLTWKRLPEITLRSSGSGPPMTLSPPATDTPYLSFGRASSPAAFVPMWLPAMMFARPSTTIPSSIAFLTTRPRISISSPPMSSPRATLAASMTTFGSAGESFVAGFAPSCE